MLTLHPENDEVFFNLAVVYEKTQRSSEMFSYLKKTLEINPDNVQALNYLGYSYAERGLNLDEALGLIQKAVKLDPESGYIRDSLGWVYFKKGMYTEALVEIKKASELEGNDPVILEHLGDVYLKLGNKDAAQEACSWPAILACAAAGRCGGRRIAAPRRWISCSAASPSRKWME